MTNISEEPDNTFERIWTYIVKNRQATVDEVALNTDTTTDQVWNCINRIGSPNWREEIKPTPQEAVKFDDDKARIELVPSELIFAVAQILTFGARKYSARNWELGMSWGRVFGAMMRHMWAWWAGRGPTAKSFLFTESDLETNYSHLWHAAACIAFLVAYEERGVGEDDRSKGGNNG